jgi:xylulokinase
MTRALLGIDLGTGAVKAVLVDPNDGRVLGVGSAEHPTHHPAPGAAEQDPADWERAATVAVRAALAAAGPVEVAAIGLAGQMHGAVLLDRADRPLAPAIIWADSRSAAAARAITTDLGPARVVDLAGSPVAAGFQAATLRWLRDTDPALLARTTTVLAPKDELRRRLTGDRATDPSDAAATLLADRRTRAWSPELVAAAGIDPAALPPIRASSAIAGTLLPAPAAAMGLPAGIPVVTGGADASCAALGAGVAGPGDLLLTLSTGAQALTFVAAPEIDPGGRLHTFASPLPIESGAGWSIMGATMVAGLILRWLRDALFALPPADAYATMTVWAGEVPAGAGGLLCLPYLTGERTPHLNPDARGAFIGLGPEHGRGHLVRAALEGATFALHEAAEVVTALTGEPRRIVLAGGGARSPLWRQIVADIVGREIVPLVESEQTATGAALLAAPAAGLGDIPALAAAWARYDTPVAPDPAAVATYRALEPLFRATYTANAPLFRALAAR